MSSEFLTLTKSDPSFMSHITGNFSTEVRALPEKSFGIGTSNERVTFKLTPVREILRPSKVKIIGIALRPSYLTLTLGPVVVVSSFLLSQGWTPDWLHLALAVSALMFLHFAVFLFNDYYDHIHGQDRLNPRRGSQIIQKGWEPAYKIKRWAFFNLGLGVALGAYLALSSSAFLFLIGGVALAAVVLFPWLRDLKSGPFAELVTFLCFGPLLVFGFLTAIEAPIEWTLLLASGAFGGLAVVCVHLKYLENLFHESLNGSTHLLARLGFDKGRNLVIIEILLTTFWLVVWFYAYRFAWSWALSLVCFAPALFLILRLAKIRSPMASSMKGLTTAGLLGHLALSVFMTLVFLGIYFNNFSQAVNP